VKELLLIVENVVEKTEMELSRILKD